MLSFILENSENYIFGVKKKAAFRYAARKESKIYLKIQVFFRKPNQTGLEPNQPGTELGETEPLLSWDNPNHGLIYPSE